MASALPEIDRRAPTEGSPAIVAASAVAVVIAGIVAAWFAAGSTGLLAHPLRHALTWAALAVAIIAAMPPPSRSLGTWAILAGGVILGLFMTASTLPAVNTLAVSVVLAAIAQVHRGLTGRVALVAALATAALGVFRLACTAIPTVWLAADAIGWLFGRVAGWLLGVPLEVGATFGGIDFLVLMSALCAAWLVCTAPPRRARALCAASAILAGQFAYLAALAYSEKLLAVLPEVVLPPLTDVNHVGLWSWSAALRSLIPWNVPLVAVLVQASIAAIMFRRATWLPVVEPDPEQLEKQRKKEEKEEVPGAVLAADMLGRFGPLLLAMLAPAVVALGLGQSDLKGKTIVAYEKGYLNWLKPEYDRQSNGVYGMLPLFVESLGGRFVKSPDLAEKDLAEADVLLLLHPDEPWPQETLDRVWQYVRRGGSLLVAAEPRVDEGSSHSSFNDVLQPTAMEVRYDTAVTRVGNWEQSYDVLAHPATAGIDDLRNRFGMLLGSSIRTRWPARPVLVGRWGWSDPGSDAANTGSAFYNAGELLGDLVLAAEQPLGQGRVFVLSDTSPLRNETLANAYPFTGRLLGYLANKPSTPQSGPRQLLGLATLVALAALAAWRAAAWQVGLTSVALSASLACCTAAGHWSGRVLPDGRAHKPNNLAYIDSSHLEAYSSDLWTSHGVGGLTRTLMRQGFLPLFLPEMASEQLERAALVVSIAPAREFSGAERAAVRSFVSEGGTFLCMVGAQEAAASAPLLADFDIAVPHSPVGPAENVREPEPLGAFRQIFAQNGKENRYVQFYAGWPIECAAAGARNWIVWSDGKIDRPIVAGLSDRGGTVVAIGDTHFAINDNLESADNSIPDNVRFWRWLLSRIVMGQQEWDPPAGLGDSDPAEAKNNEGNDVE